jgi:competence protein ComEA
MEHTFHGAPSKLVRRVIGSRYAKPISRIALMAAGLVLLAVIGRSAVAGALASSRPSEEASVRPQSPTPSATIDTTPTVSPDGAVAASATTPKTTPEPVASGATSTARVRASAEDPVHLNAATEADLRRLPGIGPKRAEAILALRVRLGRFHALEDLLKVKGLGRATLKRLRPLLRVD